MKLRVFRFILITMAFLFPCQEVLAQTAKDKEQILQIALDQKYISNQLVSVNVDGKQVYPMLINQDLGSEFNLTCNGLPVFIGSKEDFFFHNISSCFWAEVNFPADDAAILLLHLPGDERTPMKINYSKTKTGWQLVSDE